MDVNETPQSPSRILVVEDDLDSARMMKVLLRRQGYDVRIAGDGAEALALASVFLPQAVLLDLTLPDMTGEQVAASLRTVPALAEAFIVAVSGYGGQGVPTGFNHSLVKPVDHDVLKALLAAHLVAPDMTVA